MLHRATGIGSFPHKEAEEALKIVRDSLRFIPHWPQLPRKSANEGFVRQYLGPLIEASLIKVDENGFTPFFRDDEVDWDERVLAYYEKIIALENNVFPATVAGAEDSFAFPRDVADGFYGFIDGGWESSSAEYVKGQISGPVTVGFQVNAADGKPAFYSDELRELLVRTLTLQAEWQLATLALLKRPVIIFIDEPAIYGFGSSAYVGLGRESIQDSIGAVAAAIKAGGGYVGVHCCAGVDWSLLLELPLDIVNFDAYEYFPSMTVYAEALSSFLEKGGALAWGIVPTADIVDKEDVSSLFNLLKERIDNLAGRGVDKVRLKEQLLITPSCGTGILSPERAERVYTLLKGLEERLGDL